MRLFIQDCNAVLNDGCGNSKGRSHPFRRDVPLRCSSLKINNAILCIVLIFSLILYFCLAVLETVVTAPVLTASRCEASCLKK